jgi:hypothetical protein
MADFTFRVGPQQLVQASEQSAGLTLAQMFDVFTSLILLVPGVMCLLNYKLYGVVGFFYFTAALQSAEYHGCRMLGLEKCPEIEFWVLTDYKASQFLVVVSAWLLGIRESALTRDLSLLHWYIVHNFLWDTFLWPWLSLVAAAVVAAVFYFRDFRHTSVRSRAWLLLALAMFVCGVFLLYFKYEPTLYAWIHGLWHILSMTGATIILAMSMKERRL